MTPMIINCPLGCHTDIHTTNIKLSEGYLRQCTGCGQLFSACSKTTYQTSMQEFDQENGTFVPQRSTARQKKRMRRILMQGVKCLANRPENIRMLDVGCSSGSVLRIAADLGFSVTGVEPAPKAAATAKDQGFNVYNGLLQEAGFAAESMDMVTLFEVIEHLENPLELAAEIHRILRPGGIWLIGTGNADSWTAQAEKDQWEYFDITRHGGHISFFNPGSIKKLAEINGFIIGHMDTRRVRLVEKEHANALTYRAAKIFSELLDIPARLFKKGHDLQTVLVKR